MTHLMRAAGPLSVIACAALFAVGCGSSAEAPTATTENAVTEAQAQSAIEAEDDQNALPISRAMPAARLSDSQIAAVLLSANLGEVKEAEVAKAKAFSQAVRAFANQMAMEHAQAAKKASLLFEKLALTPMSNRISFELNEATTKDLEVLALKAGKSFDRAYVQAQYVAHSTVLSLLDNRLIPSATSPELRTELTQTREKVAMHLDEVKKLKAKQLEASPENEVATPEMPNEN